MEDLCLTVHLIVSVSLGCAESEVHGLFCASVSGLPLGKDGENRGLLRGFVSALVGGYTSNALPQSLLSLGAQLPGPSLPTSLTTALTLFLSSLDGGFPEPFPVQPCRTASPLPSWLHLPPPESVINTACFHPLDPPPLKDRPLNVLEPWLYKVAHLKS